MTSNSGLHVINFGCRLNGQEAEMMRAQAMEAGLQNTIIINTCAVTHEAEKQAKQVIRKMARENPEARIVVTGCGAQINPEKYAAMPEVAHILGNEEKLQPQSYRDLADSARIQVGRMEDIRETASHMVSSFEGMWRAFVQVQNGCDHRCTFCIIPYGRGPSRSVPVGQIVDQVRHLVAQGYPEIVFTGVDITSYGGDLPGGPRLGHMLRRVLALVPELPRVRLSSLDPAEMDEDMWHLLAHEPRFMPHLHLSVQAGDDMILKRMKRRHTRDDVTRLAARARALRPDTILGADVIAGFPTETDDMFQNTLRLIDDTQLTWLHVFPYSAREGTPAAKMPQVPMHIRRARAAAIREKGQEAEQRLYQKLLSSRQRVLIEKNEGGLALGRTPQYAQVHFAAQIPAGQLADIDITHVDKNGLHGRISAQARAA